MAHIGKHLEALGITQWQFLPTCMLQLFPQRKLSGLGKSSDIISTDLQRVVSLFKRLGHRHPNISTYDLIVSQFCPRICPPQLAP
jgi:hypothetical protein